MSKSKQDSRKDFRSSNKTSSTNDFPSTIDWKKLQEELKKPQKQQAEKTMWGFAKNQQKPNQKRP